MSAVTGTSSSVVAKALYYRPEGRGFETRSLNFFLIHLILPAALGPGDYSGSNRNEYQKQKMFVEQSAAGAWGSQPHRHL
jgi:hypothetical protein